MADYYFERDCRTPHSEAYDILSGGQSVGRIDLHYTTSVVHATLCVLESFTQEDIQELIDDIDDDLIDVVGVHREEFIVHVYQGRETGVFSDSDFGEAGGNAVNGGPAES